MVVDGFWSDSPLCLGHRIVGIIAKIETGYPRHGLTTKKGQQMVMFRFSEARCKLEQPRAGFKTARKPVNILNVGSKIECRV